MIESALPLPNRRARILARQDVDEMGETVSVDPLAAAAELKSHLAALHHDPQSDPVLAERLAEAVRHAGPGHDPGEAEAEGPAYALKLVTMLVAIATLDPRTTARRMLCQRLSGTDMECLIDALLAGVEARVAAEHTLGALRSGLPEEIDARDVSQWAGLFGFLSHVGRDAHAGHDLAPAEVVDGWRAFHDAMRGWYERHAPDDATPEPRPPLPAEALDSRSWALGKALQTATEWSVALHGQRRLGERVTVGLGNLLRVLPLLMVGPPYPVDAGTGGHFDVRIELRRRSYPINRLGIRRRAGVVEVPSDPTALTNTIGQSHGDRFDDHAAALADLAGELTAELRKIDGRGSNSMYARALLVHLIERCTSLERFGISHLDRDLILKHLDPDRFWPDRYSPAYQRSGTVSRARVTDLLTSRHATLDPNDEEKTQ